MAKQYRRKIRMPGRLVGEPNAISVHVSSPRFTRKKDADDWYEQMKRKRQFAVQGFIYTPNAKSLTVFEYAKGWLQNRVKLYPKATWAADEQRLRDYVLPKIGEVPLADVRTSQVKALLRDITDSGLSSGTRTRVKALLSVLFNSALNDDPPLIQFNPVTGIKFEEARIGKKKPVFFAETKQALEFLDAARELGGHYLLLASIGLMAGLRKSEMLALRWADINFENQTIRVANRVEQITLEVKQGTKAGRLETRIIPASPELFKVLTDFKSSTEFNLSDDFLFAKGPARRFINPREFSRMIEDINKKSGLKVTIHGLRHTFGREFAQRSGNIKALQAILGHSSSHTTDIYSELSDSRLDPFKGVVTYKNK